MFALLENSLFQPNPVEWLPSGSRPSIGIVTKLALRKGQTVFNNYPLAVCPSAGRCCWCLWPKNLECDNCTAAYCSNTCRDLHRPLHQKLCGRGLSVEAQLLVEAASRNQSLRQKTPYVPNWQCLAALQSQGGPLPAAFEASQVIKIDFEEASRRLRNNNFNIVNPDLQSVGCGIYPFGALLNHSCEANTAATYQLQRHRRPLQGFLVLTDIKANSELTHNYCDLLGTREQRWESLGFQCLCARCEKPWLVERNLAPDPAGQAELQRIEQLPLQQQSDALHSLCTLSLTTSRERHVRLAQLSVLLGDIQRGYRSVLWVYGFDRMMYAYPTHPALAYQQQLLDKMREGGAS